MCRVTVHRGSLAAHSEIVGEGLAAAATPALPARRVDRAWEPNHLARELNLWGCAQGRTHPTRRASPVGSGVSLLRRTGFLQANLYFCEINFSVAFSGSENRCGGTCYGFFNPDIEDHHGCVTNRSCARGRDAPREGLALVRKARRRGDEARSRKSVAGQRRATYGAARPAIYSP